jgi:hypothetical protein
MVFRVKRAVDFCLRLVRTEKKKAGPKAGFFL